jgi:hypothetical protein
MGATSIYAQYNSVRDFFVDFIVNNFCSEWGSDYELLDSQLIGNNGFLLIESKIKKEIFITEVRCSKSKNEFIFKYIEDSMQPFNYNCPKRMLKKATSTSQSAQNWYKACSDYHRYIKEQKVLLNKIRDNDQLAQAILGTIVTINFGGKERKLQYCGLHKKKEFLGYCFEDKRRYRWDIGLITLKQWNNMIETGMATLAKQNIQSSNTV